MFSKPWKANLQPSLSPDNRQPLRELWINHALCTPPTSSVSRYPDPFPLAGSVPPPPRAVTASNFYTCSTPMRRLGSQVPSTTPWLDSLCPTPSFSLDGAGTDTIEKSRPGQVNFRLTSDQLRQLIAALDGEFRCRGSQAITETLSGITGHSRRSHSIMSCRVQLTS